MGQTTGDNLRYPVLGDPANVPQDMLELATDVQTALNKRGPLAPVQYNLVRQTNWQGTQPFARVVGKVVYLSGLYSREATLAITAGTAYPLGALPAAVAAPQGTERIPCAWSDGGVRRVGQLWINTDKSLDFIPLESGTLASGDWVSVSGAVFVTA